MIDARYPKFNQEVAWKSISICFNISFDQTIFITTFSFIHLQLPVQIYTPADSLLYHLQFIDVGTMVSPTVFARRSLCYLMSDMPQEALNDAMQAQIVSPVWHVAPYLQAAALSELGMENEAQAALKDGTGLEAKRNSGSGQK